MNASRSNASWVVYGTLFIALLLTVVPLPESVMAWRPAWLVMVLVYWILALPYRFGAVTALILGLCVDVLMMDLLGQHAVGLIAIAWITTTLQQRMRMWRGVQQAGVVGMMVGVYSIYNQWIASITSGVVAPGYWYLLPAAVSLFVWPLLFNVLHTLRLKFRVQ
ncbi:rod shape-determining protein MreD [Salinibius halmophilus]|uniref:rod shape-determining protein MreD n=1 Tax=Salinibius halmophilus TaxID=1853216 RepID=UPI000E666590|nr:rod shape-determining protein MreD [Salinibius halmophilus]